MTGRIPLYDSQAMREFVGIDLSHESVPDATTLLKFRRLLLANDLTRALFDEINAHLAEQGLLMRAGTIVDATIIAAPSSTKNAGNSRDPEMHQTRKGNAWHFGMKATGTSREVNGGGMLISLVLGLPRSTRAVLLETRNRLHIYSRACCTSCGPRYQPLSRAPFTSRGIRLIHLPSFELACCRSDLFKASSTSRLTRNGKK